MSVEIILLGAASAILAPAIGWEIAKRWPRSPAKRAAFLRQGFISRRRSEGLPLDKIFSEMSRFETLARIRRRASDLARKDVDATEEAIRAVAKEELLSMAAAGNVAEAKAMAKAVNSLRLQDLLEPAVYGAWIHYRLSTLPDNVRGDQEAVGDAINAYTGRL
ncbi:hypothetical protein [Pleomorphomonas sp. PLEO]|uniref:hypothetical protein n=1 Tax=Pleomorphomonas sp. PLEO TaxID=3239306 RepID=UPI00351F1B67